MHPSSFALMRYFANRYLSSEKMRSARVLDVGSMEVRTRWQLLGYPASYRTIFSGAKEYVGMDMEMGPGVDLALTDPYSYPLADSTFEIVISGQTLEHMRHPWLAAKEMARVLKPHGFVCLIAPWSWKVHRYPIDCWRILADGMETLLTDSGLKVLECTMKQKNTLGVGTKATET